VLTENVMGEDTGRLSARLLECAILNDVDGAKQPVGPLLGLSREEPMHKACRQNSIDIVRYFIDNGGDINQPDKMNTTCLMQSLSNTELCRLLIERGADVNAVDRFGYTVLHIAVLSGHLPIVRLLIENGVDPSICDSNGDDVLQFAALIACKPDAVVLEYLIEEVKPSAQRRADLYALVAAALVLDKEDVDQALPFWIKSFNVQMAEQTEDPVKVGTEAPNLACITPVEGRDVASLAGNTAVQREFKVGGDEPCEPTVRLPD